MQTYNHTEFSVEEIRKFNLLKVVKNNWRQRNIFLYEDPTDDTKIISVGNSFDETMRVICREPRTSWIRELSSSLDIVETN